MADARLVHDFDNNAYLAQSATYANGTLYVVTAHGGNADAANSFLGEGTILELTGSGVVVVPFTGQQGYPNAGLAVINGNLYGSTPGQLSNETGTGVSGNQFFEIGPATDNTIRTIAYGGPDKYASDPTGQLTAANGLLYGTSSGDTVFSFNPATGEGVLLATMTDYLTPLVVTANGVVIASSYDGIYAIDPAGGTPATPALISATRTFTPLVTDADGNLFGEAIQNDETGYYFALFEIARTAAGYDPTPITLARIQVAASTLLVDAAGNLFGVAEYGEDGDGYDGVLFELPKVGGAYQSTPTVLVNFGGALGRNPFTVVADPGGTLYVVSNSGGANGDGTIVAVTDSGFVTCFLPGTRIAVPGGERAIEALAVGDPVLTAAGERRPVKWIGRRRYDGRFVGTNHLMLPVHVRAGALGPGTPRRDLHVSPGHGLYVEGVLVPAWRLVNGVSITQAERVEEITYLHVELDTHDLILAEGAAVESFLDDGCRAQFHNAAEYHALYPDHVPVLAASCVPRVESGLHLHGIQQRLAGRAGIEAAHPDAPGVLRGYVDQAGPAVACGWAQDASDPERPVLLDVWVGGTWACAVLANGYRADLRRAGLGSGCYAFTVALPAGCKGAVQVRRAADGAVLARTAEAVRAAA